MITEKDIINKTKGFAKEIFKTEFNINISFSSRLTKTLAYFQYSISTHTPLKIQYSTRLLGNDYKESTVDSIILHELTHWYLYINNKPHSDGDREFKKMATHVGASLTGTIKSVGNEYECTCSKCKKLIDTYSEKAANRYKKGGYISACCRSAIEIGNVPIKRYDTFVKPKAKEDWIEAVIEKYSISHKKDITIPEVKSKAATTISTTTTNKRVYPGMTFEQIVKLKRVSNAQMIPSLKLAIDNNNISDINKLRETYTDIYNSSLKYLGKIYTQKLQDIMN